jgi:hypothetical protein
MKKILTLVIAVAMILTLSVSVFADTSLSDKTSTDDIPVTVVVNVDTTGTVYKVDITWTSLDFAYNFGTYGTWKPESHEYAAAGTDGWIVGSERRDSATGTITVTNHSNAAVDVTATLTNTTTVEGVSIAIDENAATPRNLASAVGKSVGDAATTSYTVTASGKPASRSSVSRATVANAKVIVA